MIALVGPLGAGKTELARGIARGLAVEEPLSSPTFILVAEHAGRLPLFHVDCYRLAGPEDALCAGILDDRASEGVTVIEWAERLGAVLPAGRLDIDSTGLLVLTQDGRVARQLIGEDSGVEKEYLVRVSYGAALTNVEAAFPAAQLARLRHGLSLDGKPLKRAGVDWQNPEQLRFVLTEGKKRQIRRMCEQVGLKVAGLKRVRIGRVVLGQLPMGQWRYLGEDERF